MALAALHGVGLSQYATFYPPPLQIQKKPRRATFHRRLLRRPTYGQRHTNCDYGPLDDIIDEIQSNIWVSPPDYCVDQSVLDWASPLQVPPTWTTAPLPVSRIPSDQPLKVRKHRQSRSSTSNSSRGYSMAFSRHTSGMNGGPVSPPTPSVAPWPLLDAATSNEPCAQSSSDVTVHTGATATVVDKLPSQRRPSRLRAFTNGLLRLRRGNRSDPDTAEAIDTSSASEEDIEPSYEAVEAYAWKNAHDSGKIVPVVDHITKQLPSPMDYRYDMMEHQSGKDSDDTSPSTLRAALRILPEVKLLSDSEYEEFGVAIEVEAVLHNRKLLQDSSLDIIFIVDNAYYVSKDCLSKALDAVGSALWHLQEGDRVALYTTNCTHNSVSGNKPELLWPIRPFCVDTPGRIRELVANINMCGTQTWHPPRPNFPMADVITGVAKSIEDQNLKLERTHVVLLSPTMHVLHDVSKVLPEIHVHQINPAALPYRSNALGSASACYEWCCRNVFVSNWDNYQLPCSAIKRIVYHARSEKPIGKITRLGIDIRAMKGCKVIEIIGAKGLPALRLGEVHTLFARIRVTRSAVREFDINPGGDFDVYDLDSEWKQELKNAITLGAVNVHLLDIHVIHRDPLRGHGYFSFTQTPLYIIRELGGLAPPLSFAMEVYNRHVFHKFTRLDTAAARTELDDILAIVPDDNNPMLTAIAHEVDRHAEIVRYEAEFRQKLPLCVGPVPIEPAEHEWLTDMWNGKKSRRRGTVVTRNIGISGLIDGLNGLEPLG